MNRKVKNNKTVNLCLNTSINVIRAAKGQHIKTDICEVTIYFCSFAIIENVTYHFDKMLGGCYVFYFYHFFLISLSVQRCSVKKFVNQLIKNKRP